MSTKKYAVEFSKTVWRIIEVEIEIEEEDRPFVNESLAEDKAIQVLMDEGVFGDGWEADSVWEVEAPVKGWGLDCPERAKFSAQGVDKHNKHSNHINMNAENNPIPATLRAIRAALNLTQDQLAERIGVSFATVNRWEGGGNKPQRAAQEAIATLAREAGVEGVPPSDAAAQVTRRRTGRGAVAAPTTKP
jgi:DNA-binding transcriptional regulator YiaG